MSKPVFPGVTLKQAQGRVMELTAEVAALREEKSNLRAAARECRDHCVCAVNAERELREARALLARWERRELPVDESPTQLRDDTRAFLAGGRDEGPREPLTQEQAAALVAVAIFYWDPQDHNPNKCEKREPKCQHCAALGGFEKAKALELAARDEARRCTCTDFKHDDPFCPARDEAPSSSSASSKPLRR